MARLGLVTILYKSDEVLEDFFKSLHIQTFKDFSVYMVDNSASVRTNEIIASCLEKYLIPDFHHIDTGANIGVAAGNNIGIKSALADGCDPILILNNDIFIEQDFLFEKLMKRAESECLITPKIFYFDTRKLWMAGGHMDYWRALGVHHGNHASDAPEFNQEGYITYAPTCFLLVRKEVFDAIGYMDEKYFAYYDDTDFVLRALRQGFQLWYEPSLYLLHKVSSSSGGDFSSFYVYYGNRNKIYFIRKNFSGLHKLWLLAYTLASRFIFYLKYDSANKKQLIKAIRDGFSLK